MSARAGFDAFTWKLVRPFDGHCATPADVEAARAVFALADTFNGRVMAIAKPAPVVWFGEDEEFAALIIQAEVHETEDGEEMEVLGLLLPNGDTAVALHDDVEMVDESDPAWLSLLDADIEDEDEDEEDEDEVEAFDASHLIDAEDEDDEDEDRAELEEIEHELDIEDDGDEREGRADPGGRITGVCSPEVAAIARLALRTLGPRFDVAEEVGRARWNTDIRTR